MADKKLYRLKSNSEFNLRLLLALRSRIHIPTFGSGQVVALVSMFLKSHKKSQKFSYHLACLNLLAFNLVYHI
jgi:hypothetical protein